MPLTIAKLEITEPKLSYSRREVATAKASEYVLETQLARRGLLIGLSIKQDTLQLALVGNLNQNSSSLFKEFIAVSLGRGYDKLDFDLAGLKNLDGAGLAALVWVRNQLQEQHGQLTLSNLSRELRTKLLAVNFQYLVSLADYDYQ